MGLIQKLKRAVRGEISPATAALEVLRRTKLRVRARSERVFINSGRKLPAQLQAPFANFSDSELLEHFQTRQEPIFLPGFQDPGFKDEELIVRARRILEEHSWELLGFGEKVFGPEVEWRRDPLSGYLWPLDYHRDISFLRNDGSDARVVWELNRLGHLVVLAAAFQQTRDERLSTECLKQIEQWSSQNPYGLGVNWSCAMEVALRAINLLSIFVMLRNAKGFDAARLHLFLDQFYLHGKYIRANLEFSHIATSNHYFSDVAGLLWLGIMLPELSDSVSWREFGLAELLRELDKQILPDGADFEASTGYHRYILELTLYSFLLCRLNDVEIGRNYWTKLRLMLDYTASYTRPDGFAPLIGDTDSGQVLPIYRRRADDHAYLLALGAVILDDRRLKLPSAEVPEELGWILGPAGVEKFARLGISTEFERSRSFPSAGAYLLKDGDHYLYFNANGAGVNGRGSHGHNDAFSIEVSALGRLFIVDPGTYVYGADLVQRHAFRSTAYHSTVEIDGVEQNSTLQEVPFVIGDEARPNVLSVEIGEDLDKVVAEHYGYRRLQTPIIHRRTIVFDKRARHWLVEDDLMGEGDHEFAIRFHFAPGLVVTNGDSAVVARDEKRGLEFIVESGSLTENAELVQQATSRDYGEKAESTTACWRLSGKPRKLIWKLFAREA